MKCQKCNNEIDESQFPDGVTFCPYCGDQVTSQSSNGEVMLYCPYCGQQLLSRSQFCPHCGKQLAIDEGATVEEEAPPSTPGKDAVEIIGRAATTIKKQFGSERKMKKLYQQWAEHYDLPPEEIPNFDQQQTSTPSPADEPRSPYKSQNMMILYLVLAVALVIIAVGVILWLT